MLSGSGLFISTSLKTCYNHELTFSISRNVVDGITISLNQSKCTSAVLQQLSQLRSFFFFLHFITTLLRYYVTTLLRYYITTLRQYYITTLLHLHYYLTALLHYCITTLLHYYITTLLHYYITALLHYYITTLLHYYRITTLQHYYITTALLHYYITTLLPHYYITTLLHRHIATLLYYYASNITLFTIILCIVNTEKFPFQVTGLKVNFFSNLTQYFHFLVARYLDL